MKNLILIATLIIGMGGFSYGQSTFAHINSQMVFDTMPSKNMAIQELSKFEERAVLELQETQEKLQSDYMKLQQEKSSMSPRAAEFEEERISKKAQELQMRQEELGRQLKVLEMELNEPILKRIQDAVSDVSKKLKIDYVIDASSLLYANGKDITDLVIKRVLELEAAAE